MDGIDSPFRVLTPQVTQDGPALDTLRDMTTEGGEFALTQNSCDEVLTIREAAGFLKLSDQHVRRLAEAGELPGRKLGDRWRFSRHALLRHLEGDVDRNRDRDGSREGASTEA